MENQLTSRKVPYKYKDCRKFFSVKTGTNMTQNKISLRDGRINEFSGWHNNRSIATLDIMANIADSFIGKRLTYKELIR